MSHSRFFRSLALLLTTGLLAGTLTACGGGGEETTSTGDTLSVVVSFYPVYDLTQKIGGEKVSVQTLVPTGTEPHDWEPAPRDIAALTEADVFVYQGAGMEHWLDTVLNSLENDALVLCEASQGISLLTGHCHEDHDHEADHDHAAELSYDPHVWLAPLNVEQELANIRDALTQADPDNAAYYAENYTLWSAKCEELDELYRTTLAELPRKEIVVSHESFGYLCDAYGLTQVAIEGLAADSEPDPARMAQIQNFILEKGVKVVFTEELISPKVAQTIANATGARVEVLNPLEGLSDQQLANGDDYFSVMEQNLAALCRALGGDA